MISGVRLIFDVTVETVRKSFMGRRVTFFT